MGFTVYYYLEREQPVNEAERSALQQHAVHWAGKQWIWEPYDLNLSREPRADGLLAYGMTKPHPDLDEHGDELDRLLAAVTELSGVVPGATLHVSDDFGTTYWDPVGRIITHDSAKAAPIPNYELGAGWVPADPDAALDEDDDDFDDDDERLESLVVAGLPNDGDFAWFGMDPGSVRLEKVRRASDDKLRVTAQVDVGANARVQFRTIHGIARDADGMAIGYDEAWLDRAISDRGEIYGELDFGPLGLAHAVEVELRIECVYKLKQELASLAITPRYRRGDAAHRERAPCTATINQEFPVESARITAFCVTSWSRVLEVMVEPVVSLAGAQRAELYLHVRGFDHRNQCIYRTSPSVHLLHEGVARFTINDENKAAERVCRIDIAARGEIEACVSIGRFPLPA